MEFHAWLNPYRASTGGYTRFADSHIYNKHPEWFVTYNKQILFDPGLPGKPAVHLPCGTGYRKPL